MHFERLLNKVFAHKSIGVDKRLHRTLLGAAKTLCECRHLSITGLGRHFRSRVAVKSVIKRMDRLFGNARLHHKREQYYQVMTRLLVGTQSRPVIIVDWSGLTRCGETHFLRASVPVGGRALLVLRAAGQIGPGGWPLHSVPRVKKTTKEQKLTWGKARKLNELETGKRER